MRNPRNDKIEYLPLSDFTSVPRDLLFDPKVEASRKRLGSTALVSVFFALACTFTFSVLFFHNHDKTHFTPCTDPLLGGIFYHSGTVLQSCLVVVFFAMRSLYEYFIDSVTSKHFGSDGMPVINFACKFLFFTLIQIRKLH